MQSSNNSLVGTASGTFLSVLPNLNSDDFIRTILLAIIGAVVSYGISILLKRLFRKEK
ncbi:hypothetical protein MW871_06000 [Flavobacterium sp. I-SCBP12n]|uniref:Uncharacterized protein n=1 Tax=Flavobacterium pygoscelis TaxID=2893176 RepID=A0A9X2BKW2_9FLAO|nr:MULTISPECIES: hypothetical protein [Flavobacterium]MCK8141442.1 hypothetical protein [Flavobacterium pygoscelis]